MNHSIYSADRSTHLKIVVLALLAAVAVTGLSLSIRSNPTDSADRTAIFRVHSSVAVGSSSDSIIR
ncbi:hypothetical protein [Bradyrhizobium sp.]|uniref:hypothetical protein n=1 Tax=Bradyrhizobium sp. TaxID=376 RepID=UPI002383000D|nr:hypothetical protein [Bradyrhizobium sp.]MDE1937050.1 hypothetical protein [Bradyrhizobium sp.]